MRRASACGWMRSAGPAKHSLIPLCHHCYKGCDDGERDLLVAPYTSECILVSYQCATCAATVSGFSGSCHMVYVVILNANLYQVYRSREHQLRNEVGILANAHGTGVHDAWAVSFCYKCMQSMYCVHNLARIDVPFSRTGMVVGCHHSPTSARYEGCHRHRRAGVRVNVAFLQKCRYIGRRFCTCSPKEMLFINMLALLQANRRVLPDTVSHVICWIACASIRTLCQPSCWVWLCLLTRALEQSACSRASLGRPIVPIEPPSSLAFVHLFPLYANRVCDICRFGGDVARPMVASLFLSDLTGYH